MSSITRSACDGCRTAGNFAALIFLPAGGMPWGPSWLRQDQVRSAGDEFGPEFRQIVEEAGCRSQAEAEGAKVGACRAGESVGHRPGVRHRRRGTWRVA